jgi:hypothetical protein
MGKNKAAVAYPAAAIDGDGRAPGSYIEASIKSSGLSREEWFKRFNEGIAATGHTANITDGASFQQWIDERYSGYSKQGISNDGYGTAKGPGLYHDMLTINRVGSSGLNDNLKKGEPRKNLLYDTGWQYKATLKFPVSTIDASGKKKTTYKYADLSKANYIARTMKLKDGVLTAADGGHVGDIYKVYDPQNPENFTYAMLGDSSPNTAKTNDRNKTEVTTPAIESLGWSGTPNGGIKGSPSLVAKRLGPNTMMKQSGSRLMPYAPATEPTNAQIIRDGEILDWKLRLKPEAPKSSGSFQLKLGENTVMLGPDALPAGYADATCLHTGGGYIAEGSQSVFVGKGLWNAARVDDTTSDGYFVTTGALTVEIGD